MEFADTKTKPFNINDNSSNSPIIKTPDPIKKYSDIPYSATLPLMDTKIDVLNNNDSKCTRFMRKKFFCIIVILLFSIALFEFFTAITEKLSDNHISDIYSLFSNNLKKFLDFNNKTNVTLHVNNTE
jgi:hypothetical protein